MKYFLQTLVLLLFCSLSLLAQSDLSRNDGIAAYRSGDFDKAATLLQAAVNADKSDHLASLYLGAAFVKLGKEKEAIEAFKNSLVDYNGPLGTYVNYKSPDEKVDQDVIFIKKPRAQYTDLARQNQVQGTVKLAVEFLADGKIGFVFAFQTLPDGLTDRTVDAAKSIEFEPAKVGSHAVTTVKVQSYTFNIY